MHLQIMDALHTKNIFYLLHSLGMISRSELTTYVLLYSKMALSVSYYYAEDTLDTMMQGGVDEVSWNCKEIH
jgi:hypothetical protein